MSDLEFENHGSIITCEPLTEAGKQWLEDNVPSEGYQWMGRRLCIDYRHAWDIFQGARGDGLEVE